MTEMVTIVVATKDALPLLRGLVESICAIRLEATELVIVDGASTDGTVAWLESLAPGGWSELLSWESQADSGIAEAWNRGIARARGEWVVFLGADDRVTDAVDWNAAVEACRALPADCGVVAFPVRIVSPSGTPITEEQPRVDGPASLSAVNAVPHQGAFHRRSLWRNYGDFDTSFGIAADYEFLLRLRAAGVVIRASLGPPPVAMTFGGASKRNPLANLREFRRAQRKHGIHKPPLPWCRDWCFASLRCLASCALSDAAIRRWADCVRRFRGLPPVWDVP